MGDSLKFQEVYYYNTLPLDFDWSVSLHLPRVSVRKCFLPTSLTSGAKMATAVDASDDVLLTEEQEAKLEAKLERKIAAKRKANRKPGSGGVRPGAGRPRKDPRPLDTDAPTFTPEPAAIAPILPGLVGLDQRRDHSVSASLPSSNFAWLMRMR